MDLVDEFVVYLAPKLIGAEKLAIGSIDVPSIDQAKALDFQEVRKLGEDVLIVATPKREN
jgi:diaminohydroxyphosphoribosylaminopyrimidine deaminase/5-amino-6-(5-phosphoribosylamino)uracil reductase